MFHYKKIDPRITFTEQQEDEAAKLVNFDLWDLAPKIMSYILLVMILYTIYTIFKYGAWGNIIYDIIFLIIAELINWPIIYNYEKKLYLTKCRLRREDLLRSGYTFDPETGARL